ncbi:protein DWARF AND LOW-TILLERING-like [Panicum virgatum]|uniref:protein DWARF AND LOW-TILLERING-like n=1 Tax=Panicum virgatum TaxID=38727 RepID=UPI0019D681E9|nr:protein DWARF AND LOW-TILLERING-like [Panicum virgatum]
MLAGCSFSSSRHQMSTAQRFESSPAASPSGATAATAPPPRASRPETPGPPPPHAPFAPIWRRRSPRRCHGAPSRSPTAMAPAASGSGAAEPSSGPTRRAPARSMEGPSSAPRGPEWVAMGEAGQEAMELVVALTACADSLAARNHDTANYYMARLGEMASLTNRVAAYFASGGRRPEAGRSGFVGRRRRQQGGGGATAAGGRRSDGSRGAGERRQQGGSRGAAAEGGRLVFFF